MVKRFKIVSLLLVVVLVLGMSMVGCGEQKDAKTETSSVETTKAGSAAETTAAEALKAVNLKMLMVVFEEQKGFPDVLAEINTKLNKDINATLEVEFVPFAEREKKLPLLLASGEDFDILPNYGYFTEVVKGAYYDITDMLDTVAPKVKAKYSPTQWGAVTVNGRIYAVPSSCATTDNRLAAVRGDILKKAGMDSVKTIEDIEKYLQYVKDNEKDILPFDGTLMDFTELTKTYLTAGHGFASISGDAYGTGGYINLKDVNDTKIYSREEIDQTILIPYYKKLYDMQKRGLWTKGVLVNTTQAFNLIIEGKTAFSAHKIEGVNDIFKLTANSHPEWDIQLFPLYDNQYMKAIMQVNGLSINANSKNPERALMFIEKLATDNAYHDLTVFGIEGKNYRVLENGKYMLPEGLAAENNVFKHRQLGSWMWDDMRAMTQWGDNHPYFDEFLKLCDKNAVNHPYIGAPFDLSSVKNEVAAVANVDATYGNPLQTGLVDPDATMEEYWKKLKEAGYDKLNEAYRQQAEAFLKAKK